MGDSVTRERILIVDDEPDILALLEDALRREGFTEIARAATGEEAVALCTDNPPDLVILDIMLPGIDGLEACKRLRETTSCPIIFLSAKSDEVDRILGLATGGDDYVTKPFSPKEIVWRAKAQFRRRNLCESDPRKTKEIGPLCVDFCRCLVHVAGRPVELTAREFEMVAFLARNAGRVVSRERLYEAVWSEDSFGCDNTVMVHIRHIREKIEADPANPRMLVTVKGLGYKLVDGDGR